MRIISSFFNIKYKGTEPVYLIPPIIEKNNSINNPDDKLVIVYFSTYGSSNYKELFIKILKMNKYRKDLKFKVYTNLNFSEYQNYSNIIFCNFSSNFKNDLRNCRFVISTSGHQLISECIYYNKPLLLTSFNTFEQNYNLKMIEKFHLGKRIINFDLKELNKFINNIEKYSKNIIEYKKNNMKYDWEALFNKYIEQILEV